MSSFILNTIRETKALESEMHYWEIKVESSDSSNFMLIGIVFAKKVDIKCKYDQKESTKGNKKELMRDESGKNSDQIEKLWLSVWPEVRGTADTDGGAYSPFRSILLVLTHDFIIIQLYEPAGGDGQDGLNDADAGLRTILDAV